MPRLKRSKPPEVFLDSSVIIAATLSPIGGSFCLFQEAKLNRIKIYISHFIFTEVITVLQRKYPAKLSLFYELVREAPINFVKDPSSKLVATLTNFISPDDAPILAAAIKSKPNFLITWDKKHFLKKEVISNVSFIICTPKEFLQKFWKRK